jgi:flagellar M-ring protein FliF
MTAQEHAQGLLANLVNLGWRRLTALGVIGLLVFVITGVGGYYLSRPSFEVLYAGLDRQDVSGIGEALREADIPFDVSSDGATILVRYSQTAQARMLLAEKGLPHSSNAGYELYDKLGSLGLTSFMQDVTRVRALEGELARTIQTMNGIRAARIHIVLPDEGSFRRAKQPPSASVMIRAETLDDGRSAQAIRHLVAAAVPGMTIDQVTVLSSDGTLLASGGDTADAAPGRMITLEKTVSRDIQDNIRKTLTPYLGVQNFQISVATKLNTDSKQTNETIFNPDGRVERSTRVVKETQTSQNSTPQAPTSVQQALPQNQIVGSDGKQSNEDNSKREELTNYEVSSKSITTVSGGYAVEHLSIAVVVNHASLAAALGDKAPPDAVDKRLADIEQLVASASGLNKARGDTIKVMAVDFVDTGHELEPVASAGIADLLLRQSGTAINALTVLVVAALLIWFGIRPLTKALLPQEQPAPVQENALMIGEPDLALPEMNLDMNLDTTGVPAFEGWSDTNLIEDLTSKPKRSPQKRLEQMVQFDEAQAAAILKQWVHQGGLA